ncbi:MAG: 23S rRNA (guanosine(2251)-2'-O)-methyltransferase RlmB [Firmicutes bacterium]|nr:23S rRNA (guanosine(2251)-2'-O)-methyltransferase RlmB [Bacillota bacterium]
MSIQIYGKNPALEVCKSEKKIFKAILVEGFHHESLPLLRQKQIPIEYLSKSEFGRLFPSSSQGIVLEIEDYKTYSLEELVPTLDLSKNPFLLMLDEIEDPHNLGAIIRSAEAGGVDAIIIPKNRSAKLSATVAKTSAGAIEHVKVVEVVNLTSTIEKLKKEGFWIVGTDLLAEENYQKIFIDRPLVLIIGSEGFGIRRLIKEHADLNVKIPMVGKMNSLNASVSAGILIFDILRRKQG